MALYFECLINKNALKNALLHTVFLLAILPTGLNFETFKTMKNKSIKILKFSSHYNYKYRLDYTNGKIYNF